MKKTYIAPRTKVYNVKANNQLMAASIKSTAAGIGNGGDTSSLTGITSVDSKDLFFDSEE